MTFRVDLRRSLVLGAVVALTMAAAAIPAGAEDDEFPLPVTHQVKGLPLAGVGGTGSAGVSSFKNVSGLICTTPTSNAANVNTDCEGDAPHNETAIAVNPTNPDNMVSAANDYQLRLSPGGYIYETAYTRAHVTFDAGKTWSTYGIKYKSYISTGDPGLAFDADGTLYSSTLGFLWSQGLGCCTAPDILVAHSNDGGKTWSDPSKVATGTGSFTSVSRNVLDKEAITAWGHGNAIVTWTRYNDGQLGSYISSPIYASVTHDGGKTWSTPVQISGSAAFCVGARGGTACDQDQGSVPVVGADGFVYVSYMNFAEPTTTGRDQYLVVRVDPATGNRLAGPWKVGLIYDGFTDFPLAVGGRQTYQDSQFRTWAFGNIAADPTTPGHLAMVWYDMRNSTLPAPADPYAATTNSDVIVSQSWNGGVTWTAPAALTIARDQFQGWAAYDASGLLRIGYFDRSYNAANHKYGYTLATETGAGTLAFSTSQLTTVLSDPTKNDRWFSGATPNPDFPHPTTFLGDYSGIAATPSGGVVAVWTDMRLSSSFGGRTGADEDMFFASAP
jgi:hypothetical protein